MAIIDKHGLLVDSAALRARGLELGCGPRKVYGDAIGVDRLDHPAVDVVGDALDVLRALPPSSVGRVTAHHFIEHLDDVGALLAQVARVLVPEGTAHFVVPHFSNPYYYSDPTHRTPFGLYTFSYFAANNLYRRKVPAYARLPQLEVTAVKLGFGSPHPTLLRHAGRRAFGRLLNTHPRLQEIYEERLCYLVPCYEIHTWLKRSAE